MYSNTFVGFSVCPNRSSNPLHMNSVAFSHDEEIEEVRTNHRVMPKTLGSFGVLFLFDCI